MTQLCQRETDFARHNVSVAVVSFDVGPLAIAYVQKNQLKWPLLLDSDLQMYRAYGMERAHWWDLAGPISIWRYLKLMFRGNRLSQSGKDWFQLGGDVLIDPTGTVRMHYISRTPHDRPSPDSIFEHVLRQTNR